MSSNGRQFVGKKTHKSKDNNKSSKRKVNHSLDQMESEGHIKANETTFGPFIELEIRKEDKHKAINKGVVDRNQENHSIARKSSKHKKKTVSPNESIKCNKALNLETIAKESTNDENRPQNQTTLRRSNRIRKATQLYSQEVIPKKSRKVSEEQNRLDVICEESIADNLQCVETEDKSEEKSIKAIIASFASQKSLKKRKSIGRKSIAKSKFRNKRRFTNYQKLNFVEKGNLELLHKKLGLISKRLSVIPETQESEDS